MAVQEEYRTALEQHADDLLGRLYGVLYARTLVGINTPEAIKILERILELDPADPQAHLKLIEIYAAPAFRDDAKLMANADAYWKACPSSLSGYTYVSRVSDPEFASRTAARLRAALQGRTGDEAISLYFYTLWGLEFRAVPLNAQEPVRERIRHDVEMLRALDTKRLPVLRALAQGYEIVGDTDGAK